MLAMRQGARRLALFSLLGVLLLGPSGCGDPSWRILAEVDSGWLLGVTASADRLLCAGGQPGSAGRPGTGAVTRLRGTGTSQLDSIASPVPGMLWWVHDLGGGVAWLAGEGGAVLRYAEGEGGAAPELRPIPAATTAVLYGVFAFSDEDVWAVGGDDGGAGVVLHGGLGGLAIDPAAPKTGVLYKVFATDPEHLFFVGAGGAVLRRTAGTWTLDASPVPRNERLLTVHGRAADEVYAVGGLGTARLVRWAGAAWSALPTADLGGLNGVFASPGGEVLLVGARGLVAAGPGGGPFAAAPALTTLDLHGAFVLGQERLAVGGNLAQFGIPGVRARGILLQQGGPGRQPSDR